LLTLSPHDEAKGARFEKIPNSYNVCVCSLLTTAS